MVRFTTPSLYTSREEAPVDVNTYVGVEVGLHTFLTSLLDECEWSDSRPHHFTLQGKKPRLIGWGLDVRYGEEEQLCHYQESKPSHFAGYSVAAS
jgi:hypothetical protein